MLFEFNEEKNLILREIRRVNFEDAIDEIKKGRVLDDIKHPSKKYPHQRIFILKIKEHIYVVPYVRKSKEIVFLKTLYPSRKLTKSFKKK